MLENQKLPELEYAKHFNDAICQRLDRHFVGEIDAEGRGRRALVVGLFGEWGSGKTLHLQHIEAYFKNRLSQMSRSGSTPETLTIPIFFNAWRYEAEPHLIIPLLKTTQYQLNNWYEVYQNLPVTGEPKEKPQDSASQSTTQDAGGIADDGGKDDSKWDWLKKRAKKAAALAGALASGLKGDFNIGVVNVGVDAGKIVNNVKEVFQPTEEEKKVYDYIEQLGSLYYDFERQIAELTGRSDNNKNLNLLFLVDDLDRCLPEKSVQMLESIKLFLDVEGCAFVMALDDEVVERGISHRYRDYDRSRGQRGMESIAYSLRPERYRQFCNEFDGKPNNPITGHEYLEKIVQVPVRIPAPTRSQVEDYLLNHFSDLFGIKGATDGTPT